MMKKIILILLIGWGLFVFYNKFLASTMEPFFTRHKENVDFFGVSSPYTD